MQEADWLILIFENMLENIAITTYLYESITTYHWLCNDMVMVDIVAKGQDGVKFH